MSLVLSLAKNIVLKTNRNYCMFLSIPSNAEVLILYIHDQRHFNVKYKNATYTIVDKVKTEFITYLSAHIKFSLKAHSKYAITDHND